MLKHLTVRNLTVFPEANFDFARGLNIIIGENGCGKSHLLKSMYAVLATGYQSKQHLNERPTQVFLQKSYADKLLTVLRPETLGRLARRKQGAERCELSFNFDNKSLDTSFVFSTRSKSEVQMEKAPEQWLVKPPVFIPTRELLTLCPWFISLYEHTYVEFEETWRDTCSLLNAPTVKGAREKRIAELLKPLEEAMGGKVFVDSKSGRFYLSIVGEGNLEMPLIAEGLRKLAMLARLISTGTLLEQGYLFWDEPETNLNPKLIKLIAKVLLHLCQNGIQIFMATHSLFLLREIEIREEIEVNKNRDDFYISASDLLSYSFCEVSFSIVKSFIIDDEKNLNLFRGTKLHEQFRVIFKRTIWKKPKYSSSKRREIRRNLDTV